MTPEEDGQSANRKHAPGLQDPGECEIGNNGARGKEEACVMRHAGQMKRMAAAGVQLVPA